MFYLWYRIIIVAAQKIDCCIMKVTGLILNLIFFLVTTLTYNCFCTTVMVYQTITIKTKYSTLLASTNTKTKNLTDTSTKYTTSISTLPPWTSTLTQTTITQTVTEFESTSITKTNTVIQDVSYLLKYKATTIITIPTNTANIQKTLNLEAETQTVSVTISTVPVTTAPSLLFCYNFV